MPAATFALIANTAVAAMFMISFALVARLYPGRPGIRLLAVSYAVGLLTPLAELLLPHSPVAAPLMLLSYGALLAALALVVPALQLYYGHRVRWNVVAGLIGAGLAARALIWGGTRDDLGYELVYQFPFAAATATASLVAWREWRTSGRGRAVSLVFAVLAAHFLLKPFGAAYLGSGATAGAYVGSSYALFSQALSGMLLIAAGLVLLITVLHELVREVRSEAQSDPLTLLPNRRALGLMFDVVRKHTANSGIALSIAIIDIDHFKGFNDRWGHGTGDVVLQAVARALETSCPPHALVARLGGEEFVVLMPGTTAQMGRLACERMRMAVAEMDTGTAPVTISIGLAEVSAGTATLSEAIAPADIALYEAKAKGRNRTQVFEPAPGMMGAGVRRTA